MPEHVVTLLLEEGSVYPTLACPYEPADTTRPCWPHDENGEPYDAERGTRDGCVYRDWMEEIGGEALAHPTTLTFVLREAAWRGDHFDFYLGDQVVLDQEVADPLGEITLTHLRKLPDGSLTRAEVNLLVDYIEKLEGRLVGGHTHQDGAMT